MNFNKKDFQNRIARKRTCCAKVCFVPSENVLLIILYVMVSDEASFVKPSKYINTIMINTQVNDTLGQL